MAKNEPDLGIYEHRWKALDRAMTALAEGYTAQPEFPRKNTILYLLKSLQAFAQGQFYCFYYGFRGSSDEQKNNTVPKLIKSAKLPPPFVVSSILYQVGYDLEVIQRAAEQRIAGTAEVRKVLAAADKLAWAAVKPAIDYGVAKEATTTLTYFQKSTDIRAVPYAQVALIGIPFTCTTNKRDFLAIPHEVGHYVYRHMTKSVLETRKKLIEQIQSDIDQPLKNVAGSWFEEAFADIYGCLIAGPIMALDFQDMEIVHSEVGFVRDDGTHPAPIVRPLIYTKVLANATAAHHTTGDWTAVTQALVRRWERIVRYRKAGKVFYPAAETGPDGRTLKNVDPVEIELIIRNPAKAAEAGDREVLNIIVWQVFQFLNEKKAEPSAASRKGWAGTIDKTSVIRKLYRQYDDGFKELLATLTLIPPDEDPDTLPEADPARAAGISQLWLDWVQRTDIDKGFDGKWPPTNFKKGIPSGDDAPPGFPRLGTWRRILFADDWNTKGGCASPPG